MFTVKHYILNIIKNWIFKVGNIALSEIILAKNKLYHKLAIKQNGAKLKKRKQILEKLLPFRRL